MGRAEVVRREGRFDTLFYGSLIMKQSGSILGTSSYEKDDTI
jgi:hypothetical protein